MTALRIGIDVGGTNTDAVLLHDEQVLAQCKTATTSDTTTGIFNAITALLRNNRQIVPNIDSIMIGTTHLLNALLQYQCDKVVAIRLGAPATTAIPPVTDWPLALQQAIGSNHFIVDGGYEFDGREISPLDVESLQNIAKMTLEKNISLVAITGVFSHVNPQQEMQAQKILRAINPNLTIALSHTIGGLGLKERENATILNISLLSIYRKICSSLHQALKKANLSHVRCFLSHNDGTIEPITLSASSSIPRPILTLNSGATNSIRGAGLQAHVQNAICIDIGGTTTDIGVLRDGLSLEQTCLFEVGGVTCNYHTPKTDSIALGGGTIISWNHDGITIGPQSVGHHLQQEAIVFGGKTLTVTDIAIAKGWVHIEKADATKLSCIESSLIDEAANMIHQKLAKAISETWYSLQEKPEHLIVVGGGALIFDLDSLKRSLKELNVTGISIQIPESAGVANAIGAAIGQISGRYVHVYDYSIIGRVAAIEEATEKAISCAIKNGAAKESIKIKAIEEFQLKYLSGDPNQVSVTVVGELAKHNIGNLATDITINEAMQLEQVQLEPYHDQLSSQENSTYKIKHTKNNNVTKKVGHDVIDLMRLTDMSHGCGILGSGGGGATRFPYLMVKNAIAQGKTIRLMDLSALSDNAVTVLFGIMGSPTVLEEKVPSTQEVVKGIRALEQRLKQKITALIPMEAGGANGLFPFAASAELGIPVVDADGMGRAFPGINMITPNIYGSFTDYTAVLTNAKEQRVVTANSFAELEDAARIATVEMGGVVFLAYMPMTGLQAKQWCIPKTLSIAEAIGAHIRKAKSQNIDPLEYLNQYLSKTQYEQVEVAFSGRITSMRRTEDGGFSLGGVSIENTMSRVDIGFQNENLILQKHAHNGNHSILAMVPDLITIVDKETLRPIPCSHVRLGQQVSVLTLKAPYKMRHAEALKVVGPDCYPMDRILALNAKPKSLTLMFDQSKQESLAIDNEEKDESVLKSIGSYCNIL